MVAEFKYEPDTNLKSAPELPETYVNTPYAECADPTQANFPGGFEALNKWLKENVHYPDSAVKYEITGTVYVSFMVDSTGIIKVGMIVRGLSYETDKEVLRVIALMPPWTPAMCGTRKVCVKYIQSIRFTLE